ncbi:MAG: hypothetical protein JXR77_06455 [Lentisphaeria bacterium]|nr:hypothetical protein [Lentisphaeria bacterium]
MADELQALLDRIREEGLKKAQEKQREILDAAAARARETKAAAEAEAEGIVASARREADLLRSKGEEALRQASRDVLLSLRAELESRVREVARGLVVSTFDTAAVAAVLGDLVRRFVEEEGREDRVEVLLGEDRLESVRGALESAVAADLRERVEFVPVSGLKGGFRLGFSGSDITYDFSDEALADALAAFLNPRLARIVTGDGT